MLKFPQNGFHYLPPFPPLLSADLNRKDITVQGKKDIKRVTALHLNAKRK